jgi:hypothetical protein
VSAITSLVRSVLRGPSVRPSCRSDRRSTALPSQDRLSVSHDSTARSTWTTPRDSHSERTLTSMPCL